MGAVDFAKVKPYGGSYSDTTTNATLVEEDKCALNSPAKQTRFDTSERDLEMQDLRRGVQVERSYSVGPTRCVRTASHVVTILILFQQSTHTDYHDDRRTSDTVCSGPAELSTDRHSRLQPAPPLVLQDDLEGRFF